MLLGLLAYIIKNKEDFSMFKHEHQRFYLENEEGKIMAEITYTEVDDKILTIDHTFVDPSLRGQGIASKLVEAVVKLAINQNKKIIPVCPFAKKEFSEKEAYHKVWQR